LLGVSPLFWKLTDRVGLVINLRCVECQTSDNALSDSQLEACVDINSRGERRPYLDIMNSKVIMVEI
jgi:hypothetical protein